VIELDNENVTSIAAKVIQLINVQLCADDIEVAHRVPSRNKDNPSPIIVQFLRRKKRDEIISNRRNTVLTNSELLNDNRLSGRVFVNESLSPFFKELLWKTKMIGRERDYKRIWYKNARVLVRKTDGSQVIVINDFADLDKMV
jgi:hypothetical protein